MSQTKGRVTLPSEANFLKETKEILERWGADAIRDSDGTKLDDELKALDAKVYSTYFVTRGHNDFASTHLDECVQMLLMSKHNFAICDTLTIDFLDGFYKEQVVADYRHDPKRYWEVIDRTNNTIVEPDLWTVDQDTDSLTITSAIPFHEYTVSFFVYMIWDPTQMYNYITNNWQDVPHDIPFDIRQPHSAAFAKRCLKDWLQENPDTDVVRFTTFFYHFTLVFNAEAKEKFVDWFGYGATVSIKALAEFEKEYGYALRPEDIVDNGYYNTTFRVPSRRYLDYMDFIQRFVAEKAKELVELVHDSGREAMMFLGDNWIGTEPYGPYFSGIGLDGVVGSVGGGATLRLISDISGVKYTEGRFLPYFFPDTFYEGNDPCIEAIDNWLSARRAIMRSPVDRIGYGGYLSLAYKFPKFIDYIEKVTDEFRMIYANVKGQKPYSGVKVAILNSWGKLRSWQSYMVAHALWYKQTYSYFGILEALSGAAIETVFLSFDDIRENGVPKDVDVIINAGDAGTAFSGGEKWCDPDLVTTLRKWVYEGGGFIGIGEPSAVQHGGRFFQLADILGVDKELGFSLSTDKYYTKALTEHFITSDALTPLSFGESKQSIYALSEDTEIIEYSNHEVHLAANAYGEGRGVYIAGLPYSYENTRLLMRSIYYAAHKERNFHVWQTDNLNCEVHAYPGNKKYAILNNSNETQETNVYDGQGKCQSLTLAPCEIIWKEIH
ncbi:1,3-beta-galactosyl-N-acetylhexosamine phosphorylase [Lachnospiraceae bacterium PF1-21]|uniref:1,3-beta-galactosyl-N-acetylhexosamine phosphorylase n=1 Tax=Ohessyouella blattaphilus TaxID=2949333 RepID=UPI0025684DB6|nr:1,3-beta-galactosyl-N-acetylhexosamine phosphorylase [Lachnospiraceae bacterium OttesenSCG-928-J05]